ncbi:MAG TPA: glutamate racemase [Candidatus Baltobacteraceae bacterium]|nr:glutamate racemase [Candidatus Baltobacteraceae bacterium]
MLGVFDSGLGGLTVLRRLRELLPAHDLLYFADQANVPYGDRTPGELLQLTERNLNRLNAAGAKAVIMACNTSCATASEFGWPQSDAPILDLIESAAIAVKEGGYRSVGVIATAATARSGAYAEAIGEIAAGTHVAEVAAPALVPLVEAGKLEGAEPRAAVASVCEQLPPGVDAVVLACTHYPLLETHFREVLGAGIAVVDPAQMHAQRAARMVAELGIEPGAGTTLCVTSGNLERFRERLRLLIGDLKPQICASLGSDGVGVASQFAREGVGG